MTSKDILKYGNTIEEYDYINSEDLDNQYYAKIVVHDNKLYEIVFNSNKELMYPDEEPRLISEDAETVLNTPYDFDKPIPVTFDFSDDIKMPNNTNNNDIDFGSYFHSIF
jgi:hypothetical protein